MLSGCNEALIRAVGEPELLTEVCGIIVEIGGYRMAWVGERQDDEARSITPLAYAGVEDGFLSEVKGSWQEHDALGHGPSGQAIRTGQAVVCEDLARDFKGSPWFAFTESRGYRGSICLPLRDTNRTFGLLTLYSADVHEINTGELKLLQEMADNLAFGMTNLAGAVRPAAPAGRAGQSRRRYLCGRRLGVLPATRPQYGRRARRPGGLRRAAASRRATDCSHGRGHRGRRGQGQHRLPVEGHALRELVPDPRRVRGREQYHRTRS